MRARRPSPLAVLTLAALLIAGAWGALLAARHLEGRASALDRIEAALVDLRFQVTGPRPAPAGIAIVAIDDEAVREAGAFPLPRERLARLVEAIAAAGPRAVALDLLLIDPGPPEADAALRRALERSRAVIAAAGLFARRERAGADLPEARQTVWPIRAFAEVSGIGLVNIAADAAGTPRHVPLLVEAEGRLLPAFPLRVAAAAAGAEAEIAADRVTVGPVTSLTDLGLNLPLRFYGPRGTIRTLGAASVLRDGSADLAGRIVVVGATAIGTGDTFATPFDPVLPGVEVLATAVGHLTTGDGLRRTEAHRRIDAAATLILPVLTVLAIGLRRVAIGLVVLALTVAAWAALTVLAFGRGDWLSMTVPIAGILPPACIAVFARLWLDQRTERRLSAARDTLRRFHPPALADHLAASPDFLAEPLQQNAAVLFVDLSGFTALSERSGPERTRAMLKDLHALIEAEVTRYDGLVIAFMGDGAMVVFGLPEPGPGDARHAVEAALSLAGRVRAWLSALPADLKAGTGVRVGAHYGPVVVSRLGADTHQHITATGDSVNVASRLLEVARQEGALAALSADLLRAAGEPAVAGIGPEREVAIRGRSRPLRVRLWQPRDPGP